MRATLYRELSGVAGSAGVHEERRVLFAQGLRQRRAFEVDPGRKVTAFGFDAEGEGDRKSVV